MNTRMRLRTKLGAYAYPVVLPLGKEDHLLGSIDVINQRAWVSDPSDETGMQFSIGEIPEAEKARAQAALAELIDAVANKDDEVAELVIEDKPVDADTLKRAIRRLTISLAMNCRSRSVSPRRPIRMSRSSPTRLRIRGDTSSALGSWTPP